MVDLTIVNRAFVMVYKPTNITGGPHPAEMAVFQPLEASENVEPTNIANDLQEDVATEKHGFQQTWGTLIWK